MVARHIGAKDRSAANHVAAQALLLGVIVSLVLGACGFLVSEPLLRLMGADEEVLPLGLAFMRVTSAGMITLILVYMLNALLRGAGSAGRALQVLLLSNVCTILLEPLLVLGAGSFEGFGVSGAALAMVLGSGAGVVFQIILLARNRERVGIRWRDLRPDPQLMWRIIRIALPSTVQMVLRSSSRLVILTIIGMFGTFATAGYGVANRLLMIAVIPAFGVGNAAGTLVGQNLGAGKPERAQHSAWWAAAYASVLMAIASLVIVFLARPLVAFFDSTPEVLETGISALRAIAFSLIPMAVGIVLARAFDGAGDTVPAMAINLLSMWVLEAPLAYGLALWAGFGVTGVWIGRALANLSNGLFFAVWFWVGRWKHKRV
jgi:putative MATE family efflux protein